MGAVGPLQRNPPMSFPMSKRDGGAKPLALGRAAAQSRHIGLHPRFVDKDELFGIEVQLPFENSLLAAERRRDNPAC